MAYFIIIPIFVLWLVVAGAAIVGTRKIPSLNFAYPYVIRACTWATIGFLVANVALVLSLASSAQLLSELPNQFSGRSVLEMIWGLAAILGPVPASAIGWLAGAFLGFFLAYREGRKVA